MAEGIRQLPGAEDTVLPEPGGTAEPAEPDDAAEPGAGPQDGCSVHEGLTRLVHLLPRVMRGLRSGHDEGGRQDADGRTVHLGPRHRSALALIRDGDMTVGSLAAALDLRLPTVSKLVADLESAGFVHRYVDSTDRRRTGVRLVTERAGCAEQWLAVSAAPIVRTLEQLTPEERAAFVKAMRCLDVALDERPL